MITKKNMKIIRLNPELEKVINEVKFELRIPEVHGTNQIAQIKTAEFAKLGREIYKRNKFKLKSPNPTKSRIIDLLDSMSP